MFGLNEPVERTACGAVISRNSTRYTIFAWFFTLIVLVLSAILTLNSMRMERDGIFVNGIVVSNRALGNSTDPTIYTTVKFTPEISGNAPAAEVMAELTSDTGYEEGAEISIHYDPADTKKIQLYQTRTESYFMLLGPFLCLLLLLAVSFNLLKRMRGDIVYVPNPQDTGELDYTPTAKEDAEYDRNKASGKSVFFGLVDGKWGRLSGKALAEAEREGAKETKKLGAAGMCMILAAILCVIYGGMDPIALFFAFVFSFLGIVFCVLAYG